MKEQESSQQLSSTANEAQKDLAADKFLTIASAAEAQYTEKRSKFLAFAFPVSTAEEVKTLVDEYSKKYFDARHVCYAYMLGFERLVFRANDNGEPSGTAGKPILGQINSNNLTDILIIVVRYFGGVKLGTSGLIKAYKTAASEVIANAEIIEKTIDSRIFISFEYLLMNQVMRIIKEEAPDILSQQFDNNCEMTLSIRASLMPRLRTRLEQVRGVVVKEEPEAGSTM
ncbi:MAG: YigZ family protein [Bacteroidaceae bacterium]|nr:YigZ family protein [Bacteroidaceae bacterium]